MTTPSDRPWLSHYDRLVPASLAPYPSLTLLDIFQETARSRPEHAALYFKEKLISYGALDRLSDAFAGALADLGLLQGDRVCLLLPNSPQAVICQLGTWKAGCISVPVNPLYTERELTQVIGQCRPKLAVVLTPFYKKIKSIQSEAGIERVIATNIKEYLPVWSRFFFALFRERQNGHRISVEPEDFRLPELLARDGQPHALQLRPGPDDPALILFSGGTTGTPKGVVGTHRAVVASGMQILTWLKAEVREWDDVALLNIPFFHVSGNVSIFSSALQNHSTIAIVPDPRNLDDLIDTIGRAKPAFVLGVPTLYNALANHHKVRSGKADFRSVKLFVSGASLLSAETRRRFKQATGRDLVNSYGLTETMNGLVIAPVSGIGNTEAVGLPLPDVEVRIGDLESRKTLEPREVGEILIRAPQLMQGYWQRPLETAEAISDGWLNTGDVGYLDEHGYLYLVDRKKDLIKPGGFQVWPSEVEAVLARHPAVLEAGVAGLPDAEGGERVQAWVVLEAGTDISADELKAFCRTQLAAYKVPKQIVFRAALPKSPVGKVLRRQLR